MKKYLLKYNGLYLLEINEQWHWTSKRKWAMRMVYKDARTRYAQCQFAVVAPKDVTIVPV